jgi:hypothetical protein
MMRALGPGSVSSLLKVILDVVRIGLIVGASVVGLLAILVLILSARPELLAPIVDLNQTLRAANIEPAWLGPLIAAVLVGADLYVLGAIVIVDQLRRIFLTLIAGDPFHPDNVRRLRLIAVALGALEVARYVVTPLLDLAVRRIGHLRGPEGGVSVTTWFAVLVIVVLSEVFREGARLRRDAELTI